MGFNGVNFLLTNGIFSIYLQLHKVHIFQDILTRPECLVGSFDCVIYSKETAFAPEHFWFPKGRLGEGGMANVNKHSTLFFLI